MKKEGKFLRPSELCPIPSSLAAIKFYRKMLYFLIFYEVRHLIEIESAEKNNYSNFVAREREESDLNSCEPQEMILDSISGTSWKFCNKVRGASTVKFVRIHFQNSNFKKYN